MNALDALKRNEYRDTLGRGIRLICCDYEKRLWKRRNHFFMIYDPYTELRGKTFTDSSSSLVYVSFSPVIVLIQISSIA